MTQIDMNQLDFLAQKAESLISSGANEDGLDILEEALKIDPINTKILSLKSRVLRNLEQYEEANKILDKILENDPDYLWGAAEVMVSSGRYQDAVNVCSRILEKYSGNIKAYITKGRALYLSGNFEDAIECYDKALKINPANIDALIEKAFALDDLGKYQDAVDVYDEVLKIDSNNETAIKLRGLALATLKEMRGNS